MQKPVVLLTLMVVVFGVKCDKLQVEVLFESLCPDSYRFIAQQLYPSWKDISPYVNLKLVPFGKSKSYENGARFQCQHGPRECLGNSIMSCALNLLPNQNEQVEYTNCFMSNFRTKTFENNLSDTCASSLGIEPLSLQQCMNSNEGILLQLNAEQDTARYSPSFVPTIVYNGEFDAALQAKSLVDFKGAICDLMSTLYSKSLGVCSSNII